MPLLECFRHRYQTDADLREHFHINHKSNTNESVLFVSNIINRFDSKKMYETIGTDNSTSYTINKGTAMYLCTSDLDGTPHNLDVVRFVFIHELTHIGSDSWGHGDDFWVKFRFLMQLLC